MPRRWAGAVLAQMALSPLPLLRLVCGASRKGLASSQWQWQWKRSAVSREDAPPSLTQESQRGARWGRKKLRVCVCVSVRVGSSDTAHPSPSPLLSPSTSTSLSPKRAEDRSQELLFAHSVTLVASSSQGRSDRAHIDEIVATGSSLPAVRWPPSSTDSPIPRTPLYTAMRTEIPRRRGGNMDKRGNDVRKLPVSLMSLIMPLLLALLLLVSPSKAISESEAAIIDWHIPRIGVPRTSSLLTATQYLTPRFHRLLRPGQSKNDKTQTAYFVATEKNIMAAINPGNGRIVWRQQFGLKQDGLEADDEIQAFRLSRDTLVVLSGSGGAKVSMFHGLSGYLKWQTQLHDPKLGLLPEPTAPGVDLAFIKAGAGSGDVVVVSNARTVTRLSGDAGRIVWQWHLPEDQSTTSLVRIHPTDKNIVVVSIRKSGIIQTTSSLVITALTHSGQVDPEKQDVAVPSALAGGAETVAVFPAQTYVPPHLIWLQKDGTIRAYPLQPKEGHKAATVAYANDANTKFVRFQDLGLGAKGILVAYRDDGKAELLKLERGGPGGQTKFRLLIEYDEVAKDAVHSGHYDKQRNAYVNRIFFMKNQHMLNFHVFWADTNDGEGQLTGFSFQWDHDLHGNVLTAPFEVSLVSATQLVSRAVLATSSGSLRMIQDERHQWILEEGLTDIVGSVIVDLPEERVLRAGGSGASSTAAAAALRGESFTARLTRHILALQYLPSYLISWGDKFITGSTTRKEWIENLPEIAGEQASTVLPPPPAPTDEAQKIQQQAARARNPSPEKPPSLAPREVPVSKVNALHSDEFGFRKLVVSVTKRGKLYAMDAGNRGQFVWEKSLVGYGEGEGAPEIPIDVRSIAIVTDPSKRNSFSSLHPLLSVVADVTEKDVTTSRVFEFNAVTGQLKRDEAMSGLPISRGPSKDVFLLPVEDPTSGQRLVGAIDTEGLLRYYPSSSSASKVVSALQDRFFYALADLGGPGVGARLRGYAVREGGRSDLVWQLPFSVGESIDSVQPASHDAVASQGKVMGDRSTLYKFLDPNALLVTTITQPDAGKAGSSGSASVYVIDQATGSILYSRSLGACNAPTVRAAWVENWIVVTYRVATPEEGQATRLLSVELYDSSPRDQTWEWNGLWSAFGGSLADGKPWFLRGGGQKAGVRPPQKSGAGVHGGGTSTHSARPTAFEKVYQLPHRVRALGFSSTKYGIASRELLLANDKDQLIGIPRFVLDPRRPLKQPGEKTTPAEQEEALAPYDPVVPDDPKWVISHIFQVTGARKILAAPATRLESTSTIWTYGVDMLFTRIAPSGSFDVLSESFNKPQLLLTIAGLSAGIFLTRPMVQSRSLKARW